MLGICYPACLVFGRGVVGEFVAALTGSALLSCPLPRLRTPPSRHLPPSDPLSAPLGQVLALGDQTLMDRAGQHRDAVPADLVVAVRAGDADSARASGGHRRQAGASVLLTERGSGQVLLLQIQGAAPKVPTMTPLPPGGRVGPAVVSTILPGSALGAGGLLVGALKS